jgi:uncharacterized protein involved in propanediol utilization
MKATNSVSCQSEQVLNAQATRVEGLRIHSLHEFSEVQTGHGTSTAHYGELFQGQIEDANGRLRRCLLSLPCHSLVSRVLFEPKEDEPLIVFPSQKTKTSRAAQRTLDYLGFENYGGWLTVTSNIDEAKGCGSSTADCVAAVIAVAQAFHTNLTEEQIAKLVVDAEVASDNVMFRNAVLFAQREGVVLEAYGRPLPDVEVLGFDCGGVVDTLSYPPAQYSRRDIRVFEILIAGLRRAIRTDDIALLGRIATVSAAINQSFLPKPFFSETCALTHECGGLGVAVAHSGTVVSIMLAPNAPALNHSIDRIRTGLEKLGISKVFRFRTNRSRFQMRVAQ